MESDSNQSDVYRESEDEQPIEAVLISRPENVDSLTPQSALQQPKWLHPTSILFGLLSTLKQFAFAAIFALFLASSGNNFALWAAGVGVFATAISAVFRYITLRYCLVDGDLQINEGLIFRRNRVIPAKRIQNVDLLQNPVHHFFKVAEVRIETAGGSEPEAKLRVLSLDEVEVLRQAIFAEARSSQHTNPQATGDAAPSPETHIAQAEPEARLLHEIRLPKLVQAGMISNRGFLLIPIVFGFFYQLDLDKNIDLDEASKYIPTDISTPYAILWTIISTIILLIIFRVFSVCWYLLRFYGYRLEAKGDDLRISCGFFTRVSATVPRRRIQFISMQQTLLGRWIGLAAIRIETAGGVGQKSEDAASTVGRRWFVPVIDRENVNCLVGELRNGLTFNEQTFDWQPTSAKTGRRLTRLAILRAILVTAIGLAVYYPWGATAGIPALLVFIYFARRYAKSLKFACEGDSVLFRSGILTRKLSATFFDKVQAVEVLQSPFDRRWNMATLSVDTAAAGPAQHRIMVKYLPSEIAHQQAEIVAKGAAKTRLSGLT